MFLCIECAKKIDENSFYRKVKNRCKDCLYKNSNVEICGKSFT